MSQCWAFTVNHALLVNDGVEGDAPTLHQCLLAHMPCTVHTMDTLACIAPILNTV